MTISPEALYLIRRIIDIDQEREVDALRDDGYDDSVDDGTSYGGNRNTGGYAV